MKLPRLRTVLLTPLVVFAVLYVAAAVKLAVDDNPVPTYEESPASHETVAIFGASGTAGDGILKAALANPDIRKIHVITRRATPRIEEGVTTGKVQMTLHMDYLEYSAVHEQIAEVDAVYWAIGTSTVGVDEKTYGMIHVDFPTRFVAEWTSVSEKPDLSFHYISSSDISADSRMMWAREKVRAERTLFEFAEGTNLRVIAYRPDYIGPTEEQAHIGQKLLYWFFAPVKSAVRATQIGQAMFEVSARGSQFKNGDRLGTWKTIRYSDAYERRQMRDLRPIEQVSRGAGDPELERLAARAARVEIIRDDFGVPHVYGKTDADAVFGMLYAQAEDDFPRIERNYVWAIGRLAEVDGEAAIFSDVRAHLYMTVDEAKGAYAAAPDWLQALCDAFADGLNFYLATHPDERPALLTRFEPWMPMFFFEGSIGGDIEQIPLGGITEFYGGTPLADSPAPMSAFAGVQTASNGFAIAGELTQSGNAMLLINPHTSFYFRGEMQVVSEEGLNAYGAVTWGQFFIYQGFNEHTGWMHTSTYVDFMDEFIEDVREVDGELLYRYGDEMRPVQSYDVTLKYKDGDGVGERTFTLYRTHHGPITHQVDGDWAATRINWDPVNALTQSYTRTRQANYDEFREMMNIRSNSSNNTVFADSEGNIAYFHGNFVPKRDPQFDYSKPVDGTDPATDWQGLHTVDETVTVRNPGNGWIQNTNATPFTSAAEHSPRREDYPVYMAPDDENFRGINAVRLLSDARDLTLDALIALTHDPYLPGFEQLIPGLIKAYDNAEDPDLALANPIETLRAWNLSTGEDSVAMTLAHFYGINYLAQGAAPEGLSKMQKVNYFGTGSPPAERLEIFAATVRMLAADFGAWETPWGEVNRFQRLTGDIDLVFDDDKPSVPVDMANSDWGALADFGARRVNGTRKLYGLNGNSFAAVVEFGDRLRAKSVLVGGQSNDPASPHFTDQVPLYTRHEWKEVAFYREDVENRATERYAPGERGAD